MVGKLFSPEPEYFSPSWSKTLDTVLFNTHVASHEDSVNPVYGNPETVYQPCFKVWRD